MGGVAPVRGARGATRPTSLGPRRAVSNNGTLFAQPGRSPGKIAGKAAEMTDRVAAEATIVAEMAHRVAAEANGVAAEAHRVAEEGP